MIFHVVLLQPKQEVTSEEMEKVLSLVRGLQHKIEGILEVQTGSNLNRLLEKNKGYSYGFIMSFADISSLQTYAPHPDHLVVSNEIRRTCASVIDFDIEQH